MPQISVFIMGQEHNNPAPYELVRKQLKKLRSLGIEVAILQECPKDMLFAELVEYTKKNATFAEDLIDLKMLIHSRSLNSITVKEKQEFLKKCNRKDFFSDLNQVDKILKVVQGALHPTLEEILVGYARNQKAVSLYQEMFEANPPIPYFGIEGTKEDYAATVDKFFQPGVESSRISEMSKNTKNILATMEKTGGVIFILNLGLMHAQRLHYHVSKLLKEEPLENSKNLKIEFFGLHMDYPERGFLAAASSRLAVCYSANRGANELLRENFHLFDEEMRKRVDIAEALEFYQNNPLYRLKCIQEFGVDDNNFICPEFDAILQDHVYSKSEQHTARILKYFVTAPAAYSPLPQVQKAGNYSSPKVLFKLFKTPEDERWLSSGMENDGSFNYSP
jgi:hypothetical protein